MQTSFMQMAIDLAVDNVRSGRGGPFGAVVVKDGAVVASGTNQVTSTNDPTAHAEVVAIRAACAALGVFQLDGCEIYTSCEPCPMCMGAVYWARPRRVYYGASSADAAAAGFDDRFIYDQLWLPHAERDIPLIAMMHDEAIAPFREWLKKPDKVEY